MLIPTLMQRVKVRGRDQVFVVSQIYPSLQGVDFLPLGGEYMVESGVLFDNLEAVEDETEAA
jgi:hypothetical protein